MEKTKTWPVTMGKEFWPQPNVWTAHPPATATVTYTGTALEELVANNANVVSNT